MAAALSALAPLRALAAEPMPTPVDGVGRHAADAFSGPSLWLHGAAVASTVALSWSGGDHEGRRALDAPGLYSFADAMVLAGWIAPPVVGLSAWGAGLATERRRLAATGAAALQAVTLTFAATAAAKLLTGRPYPLGGYPRADPAARDHPGLARTWEPPSLERTAWPSGHTSVAVALAASISAVQGDRPWVAVASYGGAAAIAAGMLVGVHHFPSDVAAGALLGQAIGGSVGRGFAASGAPPTVTLVPLRVGDATGAAIVGAW
ncbi:MAG: phosphatase PAP2 family protein [Polyangiaceae bacterium]|nr:phosphatase PAP2 family protein [Polyangiaceae bacterium]